MKPDTHCPCSLVLRYSIFFLASTSTLFTIPTLSANSRKNWMPARMLKFLPSCRTGSRFRLRRGLTILTGRFWSKKTDRSGCTLLWKQREPIFSKICRLRSRTKSHAAGLILRHWKTRTSLLPRLSLHTANSTTLSTGKRIRKTADAADASICRCGSRQLSPDTG